MIALAGRPTGTTRQGGRVQSVAGSSSSLNPDDSDEAKPLVEAVRVRALDVRSQLDPVAAGFASSADGGFDEECPMPPSGSPGGHAWTRSRHNAAWCWRWRNTMSWHMPTGRPRRRRPARGRLRCSRSRPGLGVGRQIAGVLLAGLEGAVLEERDKRGGVGWLGVADHHPRGDALFSFHPVSVRPPAALCSGRAEHSDRHRREHVSHAQRTRRGTTDAPFTTLVNGPDTRVERDRGVAHASRPPTFPLQPGRRCGGGYDHDGPFAVRSGEGDQVAGMAPPHTHRHRGASSNVARRRRRRSRSTLVTASFSGRRLGR